jgi:hypothetical protein
MKFVVPSRRGIQAMGSNETLRSNLQTTEGWVTTSAAVKAGTWERTDDFPIPDFSLVVLIGASGAGKGFFAQRWFRPTEIISSDHVRELISGDESDQSVSSDAFDIVHAIAEKRLKNRKLAVIDAISDFAAWLGLTPRQNSSDGVNLVAMRSEASAAD